MLWAAALAILAQPALASGVGGSFTELGGTNVQGETSVDTTKDINVQTNTSVNKVINGVNVGYGMGGPSVMGQISDANSYAQATSAARTNAATTMESYVLGALGLPTY